MKRINHLCLSLVLLAAMTGCGAMPEKRNTYEGLNGALWARTSAEYRIITTQAYQRARSAIEKALADPDWTAAVEQTGQPCRDLPPAIIVDIDETVLDTSAFQARLVIEQRSFSDPLWETWVKTASAESVPGARDFLQWAAGKNIAVFYITNRDVSVEPWTRRNLLDRGFPVMEGIDAVLSQGEAGSPASDKSDRRRLVCGTHRVLLMAGDDLGDFISGAKGTPENRVKAADTYAVFWADRWVMLPNPLYGSWERAVYGHDRGLTETEILKRKLKTLDGVR